MEFVMKLPAAVREMVDALHAHGFAAYLVGGCVRDALMGIEPHDYDITTDALPEEIVGIFGEERCTWYGKAFGTVCVKINGECAEITTFRTEGTYSDGRHPDEVAFAKDVHDDLARRDFTCNAIAYDPRSGLLDPYHGDDDLKAGILRAVGEPERRFQEDALRIMRGVRFYARFGFVPEPATDAAMRKFAPNLANISVERVFTELCGMLVGAHITEALLAYPDVLAVWIPEITACVGFDQQSRWHDFTVWEHIARTVGNIAPELTLRMTMLLHDIAKPLCYTHDERGGHFKGHAPKGAVMADEILQRLRSENRMREQVVQLIDWHRLTPRDLAEVRRIYGLMGEEQFRRYIAVLDADRVSKKIVGTDPRDRIDQVEQWLAEIHEKQLPCTVRELAVSGHDAAALGLRGAQIGSALKSALDAVIDGTLENDREQILAFIENLQL